MLNVSNSTTNAVNFGSKKKSFPNSRKGVPLKEFEALQNQKLQNIASQFRNNKSDLSLEQATKLYDSMLKIMKKQDFIDRMKKLRYIK